MDSDARYSIGDLARLTGLTVKAIRFYSDTGIVPPTDRSPAGYRRYGAAAVARLELVRTLRDLGLDLATIRKVVDRQVSLAEVAAAHAGALAVQIRTLRLRRAVLTSVVKRGSTPEDMEVVHTLATLSEHRGRRLVDEFLDCVFGGLDDSVLTGIRTSMTPELPDDAEADQVEAWVELAELSQDEAFRASLRRMAQQHVAERVAGGDMTVRRDAIALVRDEVGPALAAGVAPASPLAEPVVAAVTARYAALVDRPEDLDLRRGLLARVQDANDPRRERYVQLLSVVNGWSPGESLTPALDWFTDAMRARLPR
jgi:DNA-binding transcriptional MerR regulator